MTADKLLPVNIIPKGRLCLVVGGGKVASRKTANLIRAGFRVLIIAPDFSNAISEMLPNDRLVTICRKFEISDLDASFFMVFAATDDRRLNKSILSECRSRGILCSAVDENWRDGDFITPASFEKDGVLVAVSTGGLSCRKSKMIKNNLAKHIEMISGADLLIVGTDFKLLPIEAREKLQTTGDSAEMLRSMLSHVWGLHEFTILQTCNRIELISVACTASRGLLETIIRILRFDELNKDAFYVKTGWDAFKHLVFVLAGLKSQSIGEKNIVSQVKKSISQAIKDGFAGSMTRELCDSALHISKDIRNAGGERIGGRELHELGVEFLEERLGNLKGLKAVIIGSGKTAHGAAVRLHKSGCKVTCFYRSEKPKNFPSAIKLLKLPVRKDFLLSADIIVCALNSPKIVLDEKDSKCFDTKRKTIVFDLAVPRNVSPALPSLVKGLSLYDLDDLKDWLGPDCQALEQALKSADKIIEEHRPMFEKLTRNFQAKNKE